MLFRSLALFIACSGLLASAQNVPDYSGVFLRTTVENYITPSILRLGLHPCPLSDNCDDGLTLGDLSSHQVFTPQPTVLEIKQTETSLDIAISKNGESSTAHYTLNGDATNQTLSRFPTKDRAKIKRGTLFIQSKVQLNAQFQRTFKEEWQLSKDSQNLIIHRKMAGIDGSETEHYIRQPNLEVALAKASALGPDRPIDTDQLFSFLTESHQRLGYPWDTGIGVGAAVCSRFSKNVVFFANLAKDSSAELKNTNSFPDGESQGSEPGSHVVNLEVEVQQTNGSIDGSDLRWYPLPMEFPMWGYGFPDKLDREFVELRFRAKWTGSFKKDLGEIPSKLTLHSQEPWPELTPPKVFYPLQLSADKIPPESNFEIEILSKEGVHIALLHGHL